MKSPISYKAEMRKDFPSEFFRILAQLLDEAYVRAHEAVHTNFSAEEAHDLLPVYRRAEVEKSLVHASSMFPTIVASRKLNNARNCSHVEITSGRFVLTASAVHYPRETVRSAIYRENLLEDPQIAFDFMGNDDRPTSDFHYGIVLHGQDPNDPRRIGFVNVGFPDASSTGYHANFAIRDLYSSVSISQADASEEKIADNAQPKIRQDIQKSDEQS